MLLLIGTTAVAVEWYCDRTGRLGACRLTSSDFRAFVVGYTVALRSIHIERFF